MQQAKLEVQPRNTFGKQRARAMRRAGDFPAVLYGRGQGTVPIQINARDFKQFLRTYGENVIINMEGTGGDAETVIIKEIQRDSVEKQVLVHADFIRISLDEPVTSAVPVVLTGSAPGVQQGGVLELPLRNIALHCLPAQMPNEVFVDVSAMEIGDTFHVSDFSFAEEVEILDDLQRIVVTVSQPRIQTETTESEEGEGEGESEGEETTDAPAEPEVISKKRDAGE